MLSLILKVQAGVHARNHSKLIKEPLNNPLCNGSTLDSSAALNKDNTFLRNDLHQSVHRQCRAAYSMTKDRKYRCIHTPS